MPRLDTILQSRGIHGLLLLPSWDTPDFSALSWNRYVGVYTDYNLVHPSLHGVCSDHYSSMMLTLERLHAKGYRRPGLYIEHGRNERLHRRHVAAFRAYFGDANGAVPVPPLITPELTRAEFETWFRKFRPDVVLCHFQSALEWMEALGARVPETHGFVCLNSLHRIRPCAALDLQPREIGACGLEVIVAQLHRNERGIPSSPTRTIIPSRWIEGPTVRN
jgi:LacI family transcriptional regulator